MIHHPALDAYADRIAAMDTDALRITCTPAREVGHYDPIMFDGILAAAVVREATEGQGLPPSREPYHIPLPLRRLWTSPDGLPLWAASCLWPDGGERDMQYLHRRAQTGEFTAGKRSKAFPDGRFVIDTIKGRWMERRTPMPSTVATVWTAEAIGNADEIRRLLSMVTHVGKRRGAGLGEILSWDVREIDHCENILHRTDHDGALARPIPRGYDETQGCDYDAPTTIIGWTPPYWLPATQGEGWSAGTEPYTRR